eukprot:gene17825-32713_t
MGDEHADLAASVSALLSRPGDDDEDGALEIPSPRGAEGWLRRQAPATG